MERGALKILYHTVVDDDDTSEVKVMDIFIYYNTSTYLFLSKFLNEIFSIYRRNRYDDDGRLL